MLSNHIADEVSSTPSRSVSRPLPVPASRRAVQAFPRGVAGDVLHAVPPGCWPVFISAFRDPDRERVLIVDPTDQRVEVGALLLLRWGKSTKRGAICEVKPAPAHLVEDRFSLHQRSGVARVGRTLREGASTFQNAQGEAEIMGRVIGEIADHRRIGRAKAMFAADIVEDLAEERAIAEAFDVDLYVRVEDAMKRYWVLTVSEARQRKTLVEYFDYLAPSLPMEDERAMTAKHFDLLMAFNLGEEFTYAKLVDHLERQGRVVTWTANGWQRHPDMPGHITRFFTARDAEERRAATGGAS